MGIGGDADYFIKIGDKLQLYAAIEWAQKHNLPITVIVRGSKCLISDKGIRWCCSLWAWIQSSLTVDLPMWKRSATYQACQPDNLKRLRGLEWAVGIPASLGGALVMNAGAYGGQWRIAR